MNQDYCRLREDEADVFIDTTNERLIFFDERFKGLFTNAALGDEGVLAIYEFSADSAESLILRILDALADAGVNVDSLLSRADERYPLPKLQIVKGEKGC